MMKQIRLAVLTAVLVASATPAVAQYRYYSFYNRYGFSNYDPAVSYAGRFRDYRQLVAKKTIEDGGTLTDADKTALRHRLRQLVAERMVRRHPTWSGTVS